MSSESDGTAFHAGSPSGTFLAAVAVGTSIATTRGPVAVEALQPGDRVATGSEGSRTVARVGALTADCSREAAIPIAIAAGAFGEHMPEREVLGSPDLTVLFGDALIPARLLVNGSTVRRSDREQVAYRLVQLDRHDVILAEGLPVGAFFDPSFAAEVEGLAPEPGPVAVDEDFAQGWEAHGCAPLVVSGPALADVHRLLEQRARVLGMVGDADQFDVAAAD